MALLIADILTEANSRTGRAETSIDTAMKALLHDLTNRGGFLEAEETKALVTNQANYVFSGLTNDFKKVKQIVIIDSDGDPSLPLDEITWKRYKERLSQTLAAGEPGEFCIFPERINQVLYLSPKPNATNYPSMKISGPIRHADSTTISFPERFRELLIEGICWKVEEKYNATSEKAAVHKLLYEEQIGIMFGDTPTIGKSEYSDI